MRNIIPLALILVACEKEVAPDAAASSAKTSSPKPTESAAPAAKGEVPPGEKMNVDGIPDAPMRGAIKGKEFNGKPYAFYIMSTGELLIYFSDGNQHDCFYPDGGSSVQLSFGKDYSAAGKTGSAAYGSTDASIGNGKVRGMFSFDTTAGSPSYEVFGYAYRIDSFDPPTAADAPGKIKIHAATLMRMLKDEPPMWLTGVFEGPVCGL